MSREENLQTIERMWAALSAQDWETLKGCLDPEVQYEDVPTEDTGATGPENTVRRLRIAFDHLIHHEHTIHHLAVDGDLAMLDHTEVWTFKTGEVASHQFCTMHELKDGLISRWSDFWDMNKFVGQFPAWFLEEMMKSTAADFTD